MLSSYCHPSIGLIYLIGEYLNVSISRGIDIIAIISKFEHHRFYAIGFLDLELITPWD
jgi:hypothetical protein